MINKGLEWLCVIAVAAAIFLGVRGCSISGKLTKAEARENATAHKMDSISKLPPKVTYSVVDHYPEARQPKIISRGYSADQVKRIIDSLSKKDPTFQPYSYYADTMRDSTGAVWYRITTLGALEAIELGYRCLNTLTESNVPVPIPCPPVAPIDRRAIWLGEVGMLNTGNALVGVSMIKGSWGASVKFETPNKYGVGVIYRLR